jgi:ribosomal protein S6
MRKYEVMFIIRSDLDQETVNAVVEKFLNVITTNGGEVIKHEVLGKRRLAYEIQHYRDGIYALINFNASAKAVAELDRVIRITDEVIRHLIVKDVA